MGVERIIKVNTLMKTAKRSVLLGLTKKGEDISGEELYVRYEKQTVNNRNNFVTDLIDTFIHIFRQTGGKNFILPSDPSHLTTHFLESVSYLWRFIVLSFLPQILNKNM